MIIAKADEFTVTQDEHGFVHLLDGQLDVRATMPLETWDDLVSSTTRLIAEEAARNGQEKQ